MSEPEPEATPTGNFFRATRVATAVAAARLARTALSPRGPCTIEQRPREREVLRVVLPHLA